MNEPAENSEAFPRNRRGARTYISVRKRTPVGIRTAIPLSHDLSDVFSTTHGRFRNPSIGETVSIQMKTGQRRVVTPQAIKKRRMKIDKRNLRQVRLTEKKRKAKAARRYKERDLTKQIKTNSRESSGDTIANIRSIKKKRRSGGGRIKIRGIRRPFSKYVYVMLVMFLLASAIVLLAEELRNRRIRATAKQNTRQGVHSPVGYVEEAPRILIGGHGMVPFFSTTSVATTVDSPMRQNEFVSDETKQSFQKFTPLLPGISESSTSATIESQMLRSLTVPQPQHFGTESKFAHVAHPLGPPSDGRIQWAGDAHAQYSDDSGGSGTASVSSDPGSHSLSHPIGGVSIPFAMDDVRSNYAGPARGSLRDNY